MWNSNSRRWLVNRADNLMQDHSIKIRLRPDLHFFSKKKCRILRQSSQATGQINANAITNAMPAASCAATRKAAPFRIRTCPNQIIVVVLNVLLANCLISNVAKMPTAGAAFGASEQMDDERNMFGPPGQGQVNYHRSLHHHHHHQQQQQQQHTSNSLLDPNDYQQNFDDDKSAVNQLQRSQNFKISPKPCSIGRIEGTCMFVWECIKSEGRHVGMCVDSFMFGSCCSHNISDNIVLSQTFSYTRPTKPVGISSLNHKPRPPQFPQRPNISGMTTIERPHGAGTLVIRPSGPHHQGALFKPQVQGTKTKPTASTTHTPITKHPSPSVSVDMQSSASIPSTNMWHTSPQTITVHHHWQLSTEPNFITKPRPPTWEKPSTAIRPKPSKPTKKPINYDHPAQQQQQQKPPLPAVIHHQSTGKPTTTTTMEPTQPQVFTTKPMTPATTTTTRPHFRPTAGWLGDSSITTPNHLSTTTVGSSTATLSLSSTLGTSTTQQHQQQQHFPTTSIGTSPLQHQHQHHETITRPPTTSAITSSVTTISTFGAQQHHTATTTTTTTTSTSILNHQLNSNNQETNEIIEIDPKLATIKTITAARSECGIPVLARPETRIVGGKSAPFGRWPWQVSVRRTSFFGFSSTHRCGGALINENWIATAGHCVDDLLISQIRIRVGEYDFSHVQEQLPYIERGVAKKVVHPKYNFFTYEYDLALVKLEQPLEFAPHVSPICLPQTDSLLIGMNATVTGWGRLSEGGTLPSVLQEVTVPIVSNDNCKTMFLRAGRQEFIPDIFLCAGYETGGQDSCQGDSGGPLQVKSQDGRFFLAGIISWGIGCAEANLPGVCTRISKFVPWILENVT